MSLGLSSSLLLLLLLLLGWLLVAVRHVDPLLLGGLRVLWGLSSSACMVRMRQVTSRL